MRKAQMQEKMDVYKRDAERYRASWIEGQDQIVAAMRQRLRSEDKLYAQITDLKHQLNLNGWRVTYYAEWFDDGAIVYDYSTADRSLIDHWYDHCKMEYPDGQMVLTEQRSRRI